ncbi:MAG: hypothetical protein KGH60_01680 [Candidatus Micrarchaeota archaeon]|nr:hypothetical protein [Candidatus Micrarchaeota archaeon]
MPKGMGFHSLTLIKNSILFPDAYDSRSIKNFFGALSDFDIVVVAGNHDAHLGEIVNVRIERELCLDGFTFVHGDKRPSAMDSGYVITAHNHVAVRLKDRNGRYYDEKAWLIANLSKAKAKEFYYKYNDKSRLVVMPAFNDLIMGTPLGKNRKENLNPLIRSGIFSYRGIQVYTLRGELVR